MIAGPMLTIQQASCVRSYRQKIARAERSLLIKFLIASPYGTSGEERSERGEGQNLLIKGLRIGVIGFDRERAREMQELASEETQSCMY